MGSKEGGKAENVLTPKAAEIMPTTFETLTIVRGARLRSKDNNNMASAQDIVSSAYQLLGAPYRHWEVGNSIPMWLDDYAGDPPPVAHLRSVGVNGSDLINFALKANGLPPGGGTQAFADYLVNTSAFDPASPAQRGAIALRPYEGPALGQQGHIALYVDEHKLIQAVPGTGYGVTDQYTDQETYSWGAQYAFTIYGFLPGVQYY